MANVDSMWVPLNNHVIGNPYPCMNHLPVKTSAHPWRCCSEKSSHEAMINKSLIFSVFTCVLNVLKTSCAQVIRGVLRPKRGGDGRGWRLGVAGLPLGAIG